MYFLHRRRKLGEREEAVAPHKFGRKKYFSGKYCIIFGQLIYIFWKKEEQAPF